MIYDAMSALMWSWQNADDEQIGRWVAGEKWLEFERLAKILSAQRVHPTGGNVCKKCGFVIGYHAYDCPDIPASG